MGTAPVFNGGERPISLLFSVSYKTAEELLDEVEQVSLQEDGLRDTFLNMIDYMLTDSTMTIEEACRIVLRDRSRHDPLPGELALILSQAKPVDVYIRMCYRDRVVRAILDHGIDITVIGRNWDKSDLVFYPNFHWIPCMPFGEIFQYMRKSK